MIVTIAVAPTISPTLVTRVLTEAGDIWRAAGLILMWERQRTATDVDAASGAPALSAPREARRVEGAPLAPIGPASSVRVTVPARLRVTIGDERGTIGKDPYVMALGWIRFEAGRPQQEVYLSYANATTLFEASQGVVRRVVTMTVAERETLLGRAMGRALAHEIGHYLLASKVHTPKGLMQARHTAAELFSQPRRHFQLEADQRQLIAARLNPIAPLARATAIDR
jgi:hypothetical protein